MRPSLTREQINERVTGISNTLKGPGVSHIERLLLHEDRKDLRKMLAELDAQEKP